ncbi:MAG: hypothetical protein ACLGHX_00210 [Acidimicrobiia bacterium]
MTPTWVLAGGVFDDSRWSDLMLLGSMLAAVLTIALPLGMSAWRRRRQTGRRPNGD